eukprot:14487287-Heterocapsa_arctica.AAC.1
MSASTLDLPEIWESSSMLYLPPAKSRASSLAMQLIAEDLDLSRPSPPKAATLSERQLTANRASFQIGSHSRMAMSSARAS